MSVVFTNIQIFYFSYQFKTNFDMVLTALLQLKKELNLYVFRPLKTQVD